MFPFPTAPPKSRDKDARGFFGQKFYFYFYFTPLPKKRKCQYIELGINCFIKTMEKEREKKKEKSRVPIRWDVKKKCFWPKDQRETFTAC